MSEPSFTFIDLFCGIGGFHQAMTMLGGTCVLACDIDPKCREVYRTNYGILPHADITTLNTADIPEYDVLCGGFPCQAFSHAGKQGGFEDTRGTLFREIVRILKDTQPAYFLLENVKHLTGHDGGRTWATIYKSLCDVGYVTYDTPPVMSPHQFGIPQHRERVMIMGMRLDLAPSILPPLPLLTVQPTNLMHILVDDADVPPDVRLSESDIAILNHWETFVQHFKQKDSKLPTFPLWTDDWDRPVAATPSGNPVWKAEFIRKNREFYTTHKAFLEPWLHTARAIPGFKGARAKLEWQCGSFQPTDSLWTLLFQYRPSGIRVKRTNYSPALVAMGQIVVVGAKQRHLCPREVARLQSFPDSFPIPANAIRRFGNAVNVEVVRRAALHLFSITDEDEG